MLWGKRNPGPNLRSHVKLTQSLSGLKTSGNWDPQLGELFMETGVRSAILRYPNIGWNLAAMARRLRLELEGGLCHVSTRGNDRQDIFHSKEALK